MFLSPSYYHKEVFCLTYYLHWINKKRKIVIIFYINFKCKLLAENEEELHEFHQSPLKMGKTGYATWTSYGTKYKCTKDNFCKNLLQLCSSKWSHSPSRFSGLCRTFQPSFKTSLLGSAWKYFKLGTQMSLTFAVEHNAVYWQKDICQFWKRCWK